MISHDSPKQKFKVEKLRNTVYLEFKKVNIKDSDSFIDYSSESVSIFNLEAEIIKGFKNAKLRKAKKNGSSLPELRNNFIESSILNTEKEPDRKVSLKSREDNVNPLSMLKFENVELYYHFYESMLLKVFERYKPKLIESKYKLSNDAEKVLKLKYPQLISQIKRQQISHNSNEKKRKLREPLDEGFKEMSYSNNYMKFSLCMKAFQKDVSYHITKNTYKERIDKEVTNHQELRIVKLLNPSNILLKLVLHGIYNLPVHTTYSSWKTIFMVLISKWETKKTTHNSKFKLKYLTLKIIIEKIFQSKRQDSLGVHLKLKLKSIHNTFFDVKAPIQEHQNELNGELPLFSIKPKGFFSFLIDFIVDLQVIYFLLSFPVVFSTQQISFTLFIIDNIFNILFFLHFFTSFRTLVYSEENILIKSMKDIFLSLIKSYQFWLCFVSLIPFSCLILNIDIYNYSSINNTTFLFLYSLNLMRIAHFGNTLKYLERTKYVFIIRLITLIVKFFVFQHWIGFLFLYFTTAFNYIEANLKYTIDFQGSLVLQKSSYCVLAEYYGSYIIPGAYFNGLDLLNTLNENYNDYFMLFLMYFIGQIITAYIFGGVNDLIKNMNQANNIFTKSLDEAKSLMLFYEFDKIRFAEIKQAFDYLWQKQRQIVYGEKLLKIIPKSIRKQILEKIDPHILFILKDFTGLSFSKREQKLLSFLNLKLIPYIASPYERVYVQGNVIKGLYFLRHGQVFFSDGKNEDYSESSKKKEPAIASNAKFNQGGDTTSRIGLDIASSRSSFKEATMIKGTNATKFRYDLTASSTVLRGDLQSQINSIKSDNSTVAINNTKEITSFPLDSLFLKTGRAIETCYTNHFCELFVLPLPVIDNELFVDFPHEMEKLKLKVIEKGQKKIGNSSHLKSLIFRHSSRTIGSYYEDTFDSSNIWINVFKHLPFYDMEESFDSDNIRHNISLGLLEFTLNSTKTIVDFLLSN